MHLLFDLQATQPLSGRYHGGAEYCKAVFRALLSLDPPRVTAFYDGRSLLDDDVRATANAAGATLIEVDGKRAVERELGSGSYDRFYSALPYGYHDLDFKGVEFVCTIHGLRPVELPTDAHEARYGKGLRSRMRAGLKARFRRAYVARRRTEFRELLLAPTCGARTIVVPSEHTRYSLLRQVPELRHERIRVYYSPAKAGLDAGNDASVQEVLTRMGLRSRAYFLIVSGNRWVKNAIRAIEALDALFGDFPEVSPRVLVLGAKREELRVRLRNEDRFLFRGYVGPAELEALYSSAFALVFPSLNEGFGYPPLEAMRYGTPVICSAVGSTTEVCGDAVLYVNPWSPDEIAARALMLMLDEDTWLHISALGRRRAAAVAERQAGDLTALARLLGAVELLSSLQDDPGARARD